MTTDSHTDPAQNGSTPSRLVGQIERAAPDRLEGWCWDGARPGMRLTVEILLDERSVAAVTATLFRRDLAQAGIGDGRHAFVLHVPERPAPGAAAPFGRRHLDAAGMIELREPSSGRIVGRLRQHADGHTAAEDEHLRRLHRMLGPLAAAASSDLPPPPGSRLRAAFAALSDRLEAQADGWAYPAPQAAAPHDPHGEPPIDPIGWALHGLRRTRPPLRLPLLAAPAVTLLLRAPTAAHHWQAAAALAPDLADLSAEILLIDDGADPLTALLPVVIANLGIAHLAASPPPPWAFARAPLLAWLDGACGMPQPHAMRATLAAAGGRAVVGARVAAAAADLGLLDLLAPHRLDEADTPDCLLLAVERPLLEAAGGLDPALADADELAALDLALKLRLLGRRIHAPPVTLSAAPLRHATEQARAALRHRWCGCPG